MTPRLLVLTTRMAESSFNDMGKLQPMGEGTCWGRLGHQNGEISSGNWDL